MSDRQSLFARNAASLVCAGTGLIVLDMLKTDDAANLRSWAGGSCANVLTILSYLGWQSYPVARIGDDEVAEAVLSDLQTFGVRTDWVFRDASLRTPVILEILHNEAHGIPTHKFQFVCPECGHWFPQYRPILAKTATSICGSLPIPKVFYFDRVSRGALELAEYAKSKGAVVFFEPSGIKDPKLFVEGLRISDIVKYSCDRLQPDLPGNVVIPLEVETLGSEGLMYRIRGSDWKVMTGYRVSVKDTAGAGDWCSAGLIHALFALGTSSVADSSEDRIADALDFGQILAATKCMFEGPRSFMYETSEVALEALTQRIINGSYSYAKICAETQSGTSVHSVYMGSKCPVCSSGKR